MKKYLVIFFLFISSVGMAQPYQSLFGNQSTSWNVYRETFDRGFSDSLVAGGDTVINGKNYKNIISQLGFGGYLREDTFAGKAWYMYKEDTIERLIMDMSLIVGDTFKVYQAWDTLNCIVDSIYINNGKRYLRFNDSIMIYYQPVKFSFEEGVGSNSGLLFQHSNSWYWNDYLLCAKKDGLETYRQNNNPMFGCYYYWMGIEEKSAPDFNLYPNPGNGKYTIKFIKPFTGSLNIYNLLGKSVYNLNVDNQTEQKIEVSLAKGIYFIGLNDNGNNSPIQHQKLIVQ